MRHAILLTALACSLILSGCGSSADTALVRHRISMIKAWHLVYSGRLDPSETRPLNETSTLKSVQVERNLEFADLTSDVLKQRFAVPVTDDTTVVCGQIRLTTTESLSGSPKYVDIALYDTNNQPITRAKVWNDIQARIQTSSDTQLDPHLSFNRSFAAYIAERIADLLAGKQTDTL
jgi:hypothetical protein